VTLLQASHTEAIIAAENANSVSDFTFLLRRLPGFLGQVTLTGPHLTRGHGLKLPDTKAAAILGFAILV
jgi:hypothetical protein